MNIGSARILVAALVVSCGEGGIEPEPEPEFTVSGVITDSVFSEPVAGLEVSLAGRTTNTNTDGLYVFNGVPGGSHVLRISSELYREVVLPLIVNSDVVQSLAVVREAPWLTHVNVSGGREAGTVSFTVYDAEGAEQLPEQVWVEVDTSFGDRDGWAQRMSGHHHYKAYSFTADGVTSSTFTGVTVTVEDSEGHTGIFVCSPDSWSCQEIPPAS